MNTSNISLMSASDSFLNRPRQTFSISGYAQHTTTPEIGPPRSTQPKQAQARVLSTPTLQGFAQLHPTRFTSHGVDLEAVGMMPQNSGANVIDDGNSILSDFPSNDALSSMLRDMHEMKQVFQAQQVDFIIYYVCSTI